MRRALLTVARLLGHASAAWRASLRGSRTAELAALREDNQRLREECRLLRERLRALPPRSRPRYAPWQRLRILWHRTRYGLSIDTSARVFVLSRQTLLRWTVDVAGEASRLVSSRRPLNALPDLVRETAAYVRREWPSWGSRRIAGVLARLGLQTSRSSVQRILRSPPRPPRQTGAARQGGVPLRASQPDQIWVVDFTRLGGVFRSVVVGAVIDACSRRVLALRISPGEPDAAVACGLIDGATAKSGRKPTWVLSDRGTQFTSIEFKAFLQRRQIRRRYAALGDAHLSRIDRFWRSMKEEYGRRLILWAPFSTIERRLRRYVSWFNAERPHVSLSGRSPDEVHSGRSKRRRASVDAALTVRLLDGDPALPVFRLRRPA